MRTFTPGEGAATTIAGYGPFDQVIVAEESEEVKVCQTMYCCDCADDQKDGNERKQETTTTRAVATSVRLAFLTLVCMFLVGMLRNQMICIVQVHRLWRGWLGDNSCLEHGDAKREVMVMMSFLNSVHRDAVSRAFNAVQKQLLSN